MSESNSIPAFGLPMSASTVEAVVSEFYDVAKKTKGVIGKRVAKYLNLSLRAPEVLLSSLPQLSSFPEKKAGFRLNLGLLGLPAEQRGLAALQLHHVNYLANAEGASPETKNALVLATLGQFSFKDPNLFQNATMKRDFLMKYQKFAQVLARYGVDAKGIAEVGQLLVAGDLAKKWPSSEDLSPITEENKGKAIMFDAKLLALQGVRAPLPEGWSLPAPVFNGAAPELLELLKSKTPMTPAAQALQPSDSTIYGAKNIEM
jgi:hypothetical protein